MTTKGTTLAGAFFWNTVYLVRGSFLAACLYTLVGTPIRGLAVSSTVPPACQFAVAAMVVHETLFALNGYLLYHDWMPAGASSLLAYKIPRKPHQVPSRQMVTSAIRRMLISHFTLQPIGLYFFFQHTPIRPLSDELPDFATACWHLAVCQFTESLLFFLSHSALHTPALYKAVHKKHHEFIGPNGFAAEYAHPLEQILGNYLPVLLGPVLVQAHSVVFLVWLAWRLVATYERHSGYCFKETFLGKLGLMHGTGALYHDLHHTQNNGNFGSGLDIFDVLAGTRVY